MCAIAWCGFSWDAFAAILTGVLAVSAAWLVGRRQLAITSRQNDILDRQTELNELSVKHDLFDRRYAVYADVRDFLHFIVTSAGYPDRNFEDERELELKFHQAVSLSRFYFGDDVRNQLEAMRKKTAAYAMLKHEMDQTFARERHYGEGNPEKEKELFDWVYQQLQGLPDLFGDALRLGG
jgi:hypothetical protein